MAMYLEPERVKSAGEPYLRLLKLGSKTQDSPVPLVVLKGRKEKLWPKRSSDVFTRVMFTGSLIPKEEKIWNLKFQLNY